ncbi:MAG: sigma-70 family RNA polymerase sigma factor [Lentisphaeria bacterium]|nr:sigma-70 family RNA polymerase sigma factor [Lentisphaeria bacterium]
MKLDKREIRDVRHAMEGDQDAFERLVRRFARLVFAQSFTILHDREEAEDVVQDCFVKAYRFRVSLADPQRFPQWLLSIARNLARDRLRRRKPDWHDDGGTPELADDRQAAPGTALDLATDLTQLRSAVAQLPEHYREVVTLRYIRGLDHRTMRRQLQLTDGALRGLLGRALVLLRKTLRQAESSP